MKFSIVVPVYNVEKYLENCLDSIINQSYDNFEIIIVNDGSTDNSKNIIDMYLKKYPKKIKAFDKKNGGLSDTRNYAIKYISGDYLLFCDSDDYLDKELLYKINNILKEKKYDLVKYLFNIVDENGNTIKKENCELSGNLSFEEILTLEYSDSACCYAFNVDFWKKNDFKFEVGRVHEDFGLIPMVLLLSNSIYLLNYQGYNYLVRSDSITNGSVKNKRRAYDMLFHFNNMLLNVNNYSLDDIKLKLFKSYIANGVINISKILYNDDFKEYIDKLKELHVYQYLIDNTLMRKIKKLLLRFNLRIFFSLFYK